MKTADQVIKEQLGIEPGASLYTPTDYGETERCMIAYADQRLAEFKKQLIEFRDNIEDGITYGVTLERLQKIIDGTKPES